MFRLGSIRGTTIAVDFSFLLLIALFMANGYSRSVGIEYVLLWAPVLFISVLIHELAHAAVIGLFGYGSSEIVLGGMGGATMNRRSAVHWHDVLISLAGPLASFALAFAIRFAYSRVPFFYTDRMMVALLPLLYEMNIIWGIFNLLPISPLDGGRALRNFLRIFLSEVRAFTIAVWIGIIAGVVTCVWALAQRQSMLFVALIGWYVFMNFQQWQYYREHGTPGD